MIASTTSTDFPYDHNHQTRCPNCGHYHGCTETNVTLLVYEAPRNMQRPILPILSALHYESVGESRKLALGRMPERFPPTQVREAHLQHMVHRQRCPARRPAMSLVRRVRKAMQRRASSNAPR
jgi:hypothetical protein